MKRLGCALLLLSFGCGGVPAADVASAFAEIDPAMAHAQALDVARAAGVRAALAMPLDTPTRCGPEVVLARSDGARPSDPSGYLGRGGTGNYRITTRDDLDTPATRLLWARNAEQALRGRLDPGSSVGPHDAQDLAELRARIATLGDPHTYPYDIELVQLGGIGAEAVGDDGFTAGARTGRIFVWSYAEGRVMCQAQAVAMTHDTEMVLQDAHGAEAAANVANNVSMRLEDTLLHDIGLR